MAGSGFALKGLRQANAPRSHALPLGRPNSGVKKIGTRRIHWQWVSRRFSGPIRVPFRAR